MKPLYGDKIELMYTDTDSFVYFIETDDLYKDMYEHKDIFDLSDVQIEEYKDNSNKKVVGKMKDETGMIPVIEWIALKPKLYSFLIEGDDKMHVKCKGITRGVSKKLKHEQFRNCLHTNKILHQDQVRIQMFKRHVYTLYSEKVALSNYDDKMYRLNNYEAYSYGHYMIDSLRGGL